MDPNYWKDKKVLVTGSTGFKGSWLCLMLKRMGAEVYGLSNGYPTEPAHYQIAHIYDCMAGEVWADIRSDEVDRALADFKISHVVHMAAQTIVKDAYLNPVKTFETNVMGTVNVLEACRKSPLVKNILIVTTDKVYGSGKSLWGFRETDPIKYADPYSTSKACADLVAGCYESEFMSKFGQTLAVARAGNVIGGGDFAYRLVPMVVTYLAKGETPPIWDPSATRPWQFVLDCLNGYLTLMEKGYSGVYNFGPPIEECKAVSWVVDKICTLWSGGDVSFDEAHCPDPYRLQTDLKLDTTKSWGLLGWEPKWELEATLKWLVWWYQNYNKRDTRTCSEELLDAWLATWKE